MATDADDLFKAHALRRMRLTATGLLLVMVLADVGARLFIGRYPLLVYLQAFAEAAIVGGLADWFAVSALFRRPFGLPIPHTAIIARNKDRIGEAVGNFVANNFLSPEVLLPKVRSLDLAGRLAQWLGRDGSARFAARRLTAAVPPLLDALADEPVRQMLRDAATARLAKVAAAPLLSRILAILAAGGQHLALFDVGIAAARDFIERNQEQVHKTINEKSSWWVPEWIDSRLARRIVGGLVETLEEMEAPDHPWRLQFQQAVVDLIDALAHAPETQRHAETLKGEIIRHPEVQAYLESLWSETKRVLLSDLAQGDRIETALSGALSGLAGRLKDDGQLREVVNAWAARAVRHLLVPNRARIGAFMAGVVRNWDARTLVGKMELQFGGDLQYIRVNGTLVGGLAGVLVHALGSALG